MNTARTSAIESYSVDSRSPNGEAVPLVSIICITYRHENYIRDTIEGFLKQKISFPVEILIHDDASPDRTADIIRRYSDAFPDLIKPVFQTVNQYSQGIEPDITSIERARGKYIAFCEGDDYWTDPLKLEKQVRFLENNPDYSACFGGYTRLNEISGSKKESIIDIGEADSSGGFTFTLDEMTTGWLTKTLTAVVRRNIVKETNFRQYNHFRDIHLFYHVVKGRKAYYFRDNFGVYRIHPGGINSMQQGRVNANTAYNCYRELYLYNRDGFTRRMCFLATVSLLNYNIYNSYPGNRFRTNVRLLSESLRITRGFKEFRTIIYSFIKREIKDYLKGFNPL